MIKISEVLILIFLLSTISASCNSTQIDINSASAAELDNLAGVGSVKALAIIESRPFNSVDDLIKVKGIGNATLTKIKVQGLACVSNLNSDVQNPIQNYPAYNLSEENISTEVINTVSSNNYSEKEVIINSSPIILDAKTIKTENNSEFLKKNLPFYGLIAICVIFGALLLLKGRKRKNEFS